MRADEAARVRRILDKLNTAYGPARCYLTYGAPWQLLIATMLSAQCTDARVNQVTPGLFQKYPSLEALAAANQEELEQEIHSTGFYRAKAANIRACARMLLEKHNGELPREMEELTALPGVGRKTANLVRGYIFGLPGVVVDTHVKRIARLLGLTKHTDPEKVEYDLRAILPEDHWLSINSQLIALGRSTCIARRPRCAACILAEDCPSRQ